EGRAAGTAAPPPLPADLGRARPGEPGQGSGGATHTEEVLPAGRGPMGTSMSLTVTVLHRWAPLAAEPPRSWMHALPAQHDAIDDPAERRRFARGCVRAALVAPGGGDGATLLMRGAVAAAIASAAGLAAYGLVHYPGQRDDLSWLVYLGLFTV